MGWVWLQAAIPLGIIAGMLNVMGNAQYYIHKAAHGRVRFSLFYSSFSDSNPLFFLFLKKFVAFFPTFFSQNM